MTSGRITEMAEFVVYLGFRPAEYWALTMAERDAIMKAQNAKNRRR